MPLAFEDFQGKGALDFSSSPSDSVLLLRQQLKPKPKQNWLLNNPNRGGSTTEPTSVLDNRTSPSTPASSSTLSSSLVGGGGGGSSTTDTTGVAAANVSSNPPSVEINTAEKCGGLGMEDWESVLSGSPNQEQSILRLIMGDIDDPSLGINKILPQDMEFNAGFGVVDQANFGFETSFTCTNSLLGSNIDPDFVGNNARLGSVSNQSHIFSTAAAANLLPPPSVFQQQPVEALDEKPQILNSQLVINQNQAQYTQNPALFLPLSYAQMQEHQLLSPALPPPKRLNLGPNQKVPFPDSGEQELFLRRQQLQMLQQQRETMGVTATATKQKLVNDELANQQLQQAITDQIFKASELIETGNPVHAQGILARLNHQLSPIGKPFQRAAFYFKEALQLLLHMNMNNSSLALSGYSIIFKISAYKSFSEISPILQFANFTCNQALLEAFEGCNRIHIIDFDIGYGGQWASLMQELVLRSEGPPSLKITAFASPSTHDELELSFTRENLKHFASEINMPFELEILSLEALNSASLALPLRGLESEATAVNLPIGTFCNYPATFPSVLCFVKQLKPKIVVSLDRGCDRTDVPFPHHMIHALQSYSCLLESLDAVNVNLDALQKIERFLVYPCIEKIVLGRHHSPERLPPWKSLFMQSGFAPLTFSNFTESQADCLVQRTPVKGFHVEKRQSSLALCWQRKELILATAWRC
ncbi:Scarecrow-like protein 6 [Citrus sinensis]|uniref:Scarecrow-like protein 6 n=3 Tax=Citrus TaxID=2706 RepID=A0ACB8MRW4_CITSI|nr:scarecrow-like protein 27 [Citrus sinensis]ESR58555.1 hypothetical protein CICLE_v10019094mg [Citrus x clementina]KAH9733196.1 Scarecrow-like protein 6 [Citrus sinensis]KAH9788415.1 Scarecrow-like protein 6 [Citrus sinensis]KDO85729.1 hypothetical protein CISIN_1g005326mg [Citrus sinensis]